MITCARGLDCRIQRQQIGLIRDVSHCLCDIADASRLLAELLNENNGTGLPLSILFDVTRPGSDLVCTLRDQALQGLGASARNVSAFTRLQESRGGGIGNGKGLLGCGRGFLGAGRNLLHGPAELFGGRSRFGDAAGQLFAGSSNTFFDLLIAARRTCWSGGLSAYARFFGGSRWKRRTRSTDGRLVRRKAGCLHQRPRPLLGLCGHANTGPNRMFSGGGSLLA